MKRLLRKNKLFILPTVLCFLIIFTALTIMCVRISINTIISDNIEIWIYATQTVDFFLPLIVCVAYVPCIYILNKKGFAKYASLRSKKVPYMCEQIIRIMVLTGIFVMLAYYIPLCISLCLSPNCLGDNSRIQNYVFGTYMLDYPYLFGIIWCLYKGLVSSVFVLFGCLAVLISNNVFAASLGPFLYCMAENLVTAMLNMPEYSIVTALVLNRLSPNVMHVYNYFIGVLTFVIAWIFILFFFNRGMKAYAKNVY